MITAKVRNNVVRWFDDQRQIFVNSDGRFLKFFISSPLIVYLLLFVLHTVLLQQTFHMSL